MDISIKHLKMIKSALEGRVSDLEIDADQLASEDIHTELDWKSIGVSYLTLMISSYANDLCKYHIARCEPRTLRFRF